MIEAVKKIGAVTWAIVVGAFVLLGVSIYGLIRRRGPAAIPPIRRDDKATADALDAAAGRLEAADGQAAEDAAAAVLEARKAAEGGPDSIAAAFNRHLGGGPK